MAAYTFFFRAGNRGFCYTESEKEGGAQFALLQKEESMRKGYCASM